MASILRFKRKKTEDPLSAIVVAFKKSRTPHYNPRRPESPPSPTQMASKHKLPPASQPSSSGSPSSNPGSSPSPEQAAEVFRLCGTSDVGDLDGGPGLRKILTAVRRSPENLKNPIQMANLCRIGKKGEAEEPYADGMESLSLNEVEMQDGALASETLARYNAGSSGVEKSGIVCNGTEMLRVPGDVIPGGGGDTEKACPSEYVYDFYCSYGMSEEDFRSLENWLGVEPFLEASQDGQLLNDPWNDEESDKCDDEDDSNSEGNWRNDYPEEEDEDEDDGYFSKIGGHLSANTKAKRPGVDPGFVHGLEDSSDDESQQDPCEGDWINDDTEDEEEPGDTPSSSSGKMTPVDPQVVVYKMEDLAMKSGEDTDSDSLAQGM